MDEKVEQEAPDSPPESPLITSLRNELRETVADAYYNGLGLKKACDKAFDSLIIPKLKQNI